MLAAKKYDASLQSEKFDAIIIGSGISGLSTAVFLAKAGKKVLVLEQHFKAGGYTHIFKRKDFEWDIGVHYIGDVHKENSALKILFEDITDKALQWAPMDAVYDRMIFPDHSYDFVAGRENFIEKMTTYFPDERDAIVQYLDLVKQSVRSARNFFVNKALSPVQAKLSYPVMSAAFHKFSDQTTFQVLSQLTMNKNLIGVLTGQWGDYGLPPGQSTFAMHAMLVNHYLDGGNYPIGGSARFAATIIPVIEKNHGKVVVSAEVDEILIHKEQAVGVRLNNGDELTAPIVISSAGVFNTFGRLVKGEDVQKQLQEVQRSSSYFCLYIGFNKTAHELGLQKTNLWVYPDYDHDKTVENFAKDPESNPLPVAYLSFASAKDPSWDQRHPGTATMEIVGMAPFAMFDKWRGSVWQKRDEEYLKTKEQMTERLLEQAFSVLPHLRGKVDYLEASTPLTTKHFSGYEFGELYGLNHNPVRMRQKWLRPQTAVKNLYLTGQDITTAGIGGALMAGVLTASAILKRNVIDDVVERRTLIRKE
ncbi:NAD(P)/FAD-dependent oxidoreductase [candidate division KSB1 bacterium]|nr:NAD(P)/FAD-dependent oxidoreductase [candidate division KSB1 bacterium]